MEILLETNTIYGEGYMLCIISGGKVYRYNRYPMSLEEAEEYRQFIEEEYELYTIDSLKAKEA